MFLTSCNLMLSRQWRFLFRHCLQNKKMKYISTIILGLGLLKFACLSADNRNLKFVSIDNSTIRLADMQWVKSGGWDSLFKIYEHPAFEKLLTKEIEDSLLTIINHRKAEVGDTLCTADVFYIWKPYFEWLRDEDPHYTIIPVIPYEVDFSRKDFRKILDDEIRKFPSKAKILPVSLLNINDTLMVERSLCDNIVPGDIILDINGVDKDELLKYNYDFRHSEAYIALNYCGFYGFAPEYKIRLSRNKKDSVLTIPGGRYKDVLYQTAKCLEIENNIRTYISSNAGYIKISEFYPDNGRLIKIIRKAILDFKAQGIRSVIIDLRGNPGGYGDKIDRLFSMLIDKPSIKYCKWQKLKASQRTLNENDFISGKMLGNLVNVPEDRIVKEIQLNSELYIDDIDYYVLMDKGTGSVAASICNVLQYNDVAFLVGEPLLKNALKYGEILENTLIFYDLNGYSNGKSSSKMNAWLQDSNVSTVEISEYTKAVDGVLMPDIHIPYVAKDYMTGKDAMLDELLKIISGKSNVIGGIRKAFKE